MGTVIIILGWIFILMGGAVAFQWSSTRHTEYLFGAACYLIAGILALWRLSWIPLVAGIIAAFVVRTAFRRMGLGERPGRSMDPTVARLSAVLGGDPTEQKAPGEITSADQLVDILGSGPSTEQKSKAIAALVEYMRNTPELRNILDEYGVSDDRIEAMYDALIDGGAGQWVGRYWIPVSALAEPEPLRFLLEAWRDDNLAPKDSRLASAHDGGDAASRIVGYFYYGHPLH